MIIKYNSEQLTRIIEDIFVLTGISISILDADYNTITTSKQKQKYCSLLQTIESCAQCDREILNQCRTAKKLERHICKAGLYDFAMPIMKYDTIVGFVIMGQIRSVNSPALPQYIPKANSKTLKKLNQFYEETPFMSETRLQALCDLLPRVLFDNAIEIVYDSFVNKAVEFISLNLQKELSIKGLCKEFHISKNYLYEAFRNNLGNTPTAYINQQRINKAKELLALSNYSVYQIAEMVGIYNYTYFCKLFKKLAGFAPTEYRKCSPIK